MRLPVHAVVILLLGAAASGAPQQPPSAEPAKPRKASLEGKVVHAGTGEIVRKVTLMLTKQGGVPAPVTTETDNAGAFAFKDLDPGQYQLMAERQGFARQFYGSRRGLLSGGTTLRIGAGEELKGIVFKLQPNAVIAGRVTDAEGEPVTNATVGCLQTPYMQGRRQYLPVGAAMTNDAGEYRIASLTEGRYYISATYREPSIGMASASNKPASDKPVEGYTTTYYPGVLEQSQASAIDVSAGAELRGIDITLVRTPVVRVSGKFPSDQQTIVTLTPKGGGIAGVLRRNVAVARPPEGNFEFRNVAPGTYVLGTMALDQHFLGATAIIEVADKNIENVVLSGAAGEIAGAIRFENESDRTAKGIQVVLSGQDMVSLMPPRASAAEDGKFTMKDVVADHYTVALLGSPEGSYVKSIRFGGREAIDGFDMTSGANTLDILIDPRGAQVDGNVTDAENKPMPGVTVALIPKDRKISRYRNGTTDQDGRFSLKGAAPGEYLLLAWEYTEPNAYQDPEFVKKYESKAETVTVDAGGYKSISLKAIAPDAR